jgi:hypothetical protein
MVSPFKAEISFNESLIDETLGSASTAAATENHRKTEQGRVNTVNAERIAAMQTLGSVIIVIIIKVIQ